MSNKIKNPNWNDVNLSFLLCFLSIPKCVTLDYNHWEEDKGTYYTIPYFIFGTFQRNSMYQVCFSPARMCSNSHLNGKKSVPCWTAPNASLIHSFISLIAPELEWVGCQLVIITSMNHCAWSVLLQSSCRDANWLLPNASSFAGVL